MLIQSPPIINFPGNAEMGSKGNLGSPLALAAASQSGLSSSYIPMITSCNQFDSFRSNTPSQMSPPAPTPASPSPLLRTPYPSPNISSPESMSFGTSSFNPTRVPQMNSSFGASALPTSSSVLGGTSSSGVPPAPASYSNFSSGFFPAVIPEEFYSYSGPIDETAARDNYNADNKHKSVSPKTEGMTTSRVSKTKSRTINQTAGKSMLTYYETSMSPKVMGASAKPLSPKSTSRRQSTKQSSGCCGYFGPDTCCGDMGNEVKITRSRSSAARTAR